MKPAIILLLCLTCLLVSCKKDPEIKEATSVSKIVISDSYPLVAVTDLNPDVTVQSWNVLGLYNLDIDKDGTTDFTFKADNSFGCAGASQYINLSIQTANSSSYILCDSVYSSFCHDPSNNVTVITVNALYPKVMSLNDTISVHNEWRQGDVSILRKIAGNCPPDGSYSQDGKWIGLDQKYIGLRCKDHLGWIKIGLPSNNSIKLYSYGLSR